jgi:hypothetical protein
MGMAQALSGGRVEPGGMPVETAEHVETPTLLRPQQAAAMLNVSPRTLWAWGAEGRLEVRHLTPRSLRYTRSSVEALMAGDGVADTAHNDHNGGIRDEG